jgi:hypothetical protein
VKTSAGAFGTLDDLFDDRPVLLPVELEPDGPAASGDRVFDRCRCDIREHHQVIFRFGGARRADLTDRVERFLTANRIDHDRRRVLRAIERDARIESAQIDEAARSERPSLVALTIRADRRVVVGAGREVTPVGDRNLRPRCRLEVKHVECVFRRFYDRRLRCQLLRGGHRLLGAARRRREQAVECFRVKAGGREERAAGEKRKEVAARRITIWHGMKRQRPHAIVQSYIRFFATFSASLNLISFLTRLTGIGLPIGNYTVPSRVRLPALHCGFSPATVGSLRSCQS